MYQPTLFEWMKIDGFATLVFLILILIKIFRKKPLPDSSNFLPLLFGFVHNANFLFLLLNSQGMGPSTERIISILCETFIVTTSFTIALIFVDCLKSFIHRDNKKSKNTQNQQVDPIVTTPVDEVEAQSTQGHS